MPSDSLTNSRSEDGPETAPVSARSQADWNGLACTGPFVDWRFLAALETAGSVGEASGWQPQSSVVRDADGSLRCAAPVYLKHHSRGEFVFDFAWAQAAHGAGLAWYPKLLVAAPYSPVSGPRLLGAEHDRQAADELVGRLTERVMTEQLSSAGVNFCDPHDAEVLRAAGWLERFDWQYHWHNPGYRDFDDFLGRLKRKPRKNIRAERRKVAEAGWQFEWKSGSELDPADLDLIDHCYQITFALYGNLPMLNRTFFAECARSFGDSFQVCFAQLDGQPHAAAIFWRDETRLYGRYWGSLEDTRDVHFETCYYQGIDYCIRHGLTWFEPGAQGEHKIRRGFLPRRTRSFHLIRHPGLRQGIARYLQAEAGALNGYREQLETLNPFAE